MTTQLTAHGQSTTAHRMLAVVPVALGVTFCLFAMMDALTRLEGTAQAAPPAVLIDDFTFQEKTQPVKEKPKLIKQPEPPTIPEREELLPDPASDPDFGPTLVKYVPPDIGNGEPPRIGMSEGSASPIVRMEPKYPATAARDGIEGWVKLVFSIDGSGKVFDIKVVDAQPKRTFDKEARRALSKWRYKPQIVQGKPTVQANLEVVLEFTLEQR